MTTEKESRILVPLDFSRTSENAIEVAADLAKKFGAKLFFVHVLLFRPESQFIGSELVRQDVMHRLEEKLRRMVEVHLGDDGVFGIQVLLHHSRSKAIAAHAKRIGASYIVMGTHGRAGVRRALVGSVTYDVMRRAHCPVITVGRIEDEVKAA